jgi:predicted permease
MRSLVHDLRLALRKLRLSPGFTAGAVLTLGIGIGANTTIFSWLRPLLLDPLPGAFDSSRLVAVENFANSGNSHGDPLTTSFLDFRDYRDHLKLMDVSAIGSGALALGADRDSERIWSEMVSGNFFDVLGIKPQSGRFFSKAEQNDSQNAYPVAIISNDFWHTHFDDSPSAIGSTLRINRVSFTVIGVAPPGFHGTQAGFAYQVWLPLTMYGNVTHSGTWMLEDRKTRNFTMIARLKPGISLEQARGEARWLADFMAVANGYGDQGVGATILPLWQWHFGPQETLLKPVAILMASCGLLLVIVCANMTNLLLVRATGRQKEFCLRLALGASPRRLALQLLMESLLLALAGSAMGLLIAAWLGGALRWLLPSITAPSMVQPSLAGDVLGFTVGLAVVVAGIAGIVPALHAARSNVDEMLKENGRSSATGAASHRLRALLVISEVALAVVALVGAGMFLKSFQALRLMTPGFSPEGQALVQFDLSTAGYSQPQADSFYQRLAERLDRYPGVTGVSYADTEPLGFKGGNWEDLEIEGYQPSPGENMKIYRNLVGPGYFKVMKIPLTEGRDFDLRDNPTSAGVMIVSKEFVRRFIPNRDPIGLKVRGWGRWFNIVGVAGDIKIHQVNEGELPFFYIPIRQVYRPEYGLTFHIRTSGSVEEAIAAVRREASSIDPALTIFDAQPMIEYVSGSLFGQRVATSILSILGVLGLGLAAMGLYSVMAYSVAQRTSEIGIRMALGAPPGNVLAMVMRQGLGLAAVGCAIGMGAAIVLSRLELSIYSMLRPADPESYLAATLFTFLVALAAVAIPAWRALRVDPMVALRKN